MLPSKIISGGQTGADRAGLDFAIAMGIDRGGWCPKGGRCEGGKLSPADIERYRLRETETWGYEERTKLNVRDSDATLIFNRGPQLSPGCALTLRACRELARPFKVVRLPVEWFGPGAPESGVNALADQVAGFLASSQPATLNIAGNRDGTTPGIGTIVRAILGAAWEQYRIRAAQTDPHGNPDRDGVIRDGNGQITAEKGAWGWQPVAPGAVPLPDAQKPQQAQLDFALEGDGSARSASRAR